jgi:hypothetical protein
LLSYSGITLGKVDRRGIATAKKYANTFAIARPILAREECCERRGTEPRLMHGTARAGSRWRWWGSDSRREGVNDSEQILLLTEIRDLQRQQVELTQQTIKNQETALSNQQKAIDRQISNQEILIKARKWTRILLGLLVVAAFLYLLQPLIFLLLAHSR